MTEPAVEEIRAVAEEVLLTQECPVCHRQVRALSIWDHLASCMKKAAKQ